MKNKSLFILISVSFFVFVSYFHPVISEVKNDWICIPGERVGPITTKTNEDQIKKFFGEGNVTRNKVVTGENGETSEITIVFKNTKNEFLIKWDENKPFIKPWRIEIYKDGTKWAMPGITVGTSLEELIKTNGKQILFSGFSWDYGGYVTSWNKGKLDSIYKKNSFTIRLKPGTSDSKLLYGFGGDGDIPSDRKGVSKLKIIVSEVAINFK